MLLSANQLKLAGPMRVSASTHSVLHHPKPFMPESCLSVSFEESLVFG